MEPENADDLLHALLEMESNPDLCRKLGENAYKNISTKYNRDQQAKDYLDILENILNANETRLKTKD